MRKFIGLICILIGLILLVYTSLRVYQPKSLKLLECPDKYCVRISGRLSLENVKEVNALGDNLKKIIVSSPGGNVGIGTDLGLSISEKEVLLVIIDRCTSACAEFILPAATKIIALNSPEIGFHGNPYIWGHLKASRGYNNPGWCESPARDKLDIIYQRRQRNYEFSKAQLERLGAARFSVSRDEEGCLLSSRFEFEHAFWFPTAEQLNEYLNIQIDGQLCSDDQSCVNKIIKANARGRTCVFGDIIQNC